MPLAATLSRPSAAQRRSDRVALFADLLDRQKADLADAAACKRILNRAGHHASEGLLLEARIAAHNLKAGRYWRERRVSAKSHLAVVASACAGIAWLACIPHAHALERLPSGPDDTASWGLLAAFVAALIIGAGFWFWDFMRDRKD